MTTTPSFTYDQHKGIHSGAKAILMAAGPGSGKSTVLVERIKRLVAEGIDPRRIVAITYTNAGAKVMVERLAAAGIVVGFVGTLHSFALKCLREHGDSFGYGVRLSVVDEETAGEILLDHAKRLGCKIPLKQLLETKRNYRSSFAQNLFATSGTSLDVLTINNYYRDLKAAGILDFDLILSEFTAWLATDLAQATLAMAYDWLFVDEVQDSARVDWNIYRTLPMPNKFFVGDSDQAIFEWRGGCVDEMIAYSRQPDVEVIRLETNFRSDGGICTAANRLIRHNVNRIDKETVSASSMGGFIQGPDEFTHEGAEIAFVSHEILNRWKGSYTIAVLARANALAAKFAKTLSACGIKVATTEVPDLPPDFNRLRALIELLANPDNDTLAYLYLLLKIGENAPQLMARERANQIRRDAMKEGKSINEVWLNLPRCEFATEIWNRGAILSKEDLTVEAIAYAGEKMRQFPSTHNGPSTLDLALALSQHPEPTEPKEQADVECLTIHASKGREFDVVFLVGFEDEIIPGRRESPEDARRLAYVGLTRARHGVYLTWCKNRMTPWGSDEQHHPSRFAKEMLG